MRSYIIIFSLLLLLPACDRLTWLPSEQTQEAATPRKKDGLVVNKRKDGSLYSEINYKDGIKHGLAKSYSKSGKIQNEIIYEQGYKNGVSKIYYDNGEVRRSTTYKLDRKNGPLMSYFTNGNLSSSVTYKDDMPGNDLKEYVKSGKELSTYPELKYQVVDRLMQTGEYTVKFYFTKDNNRAEFYIGELIDGKYFDRSTLEQMPEVNAQGVLTFKPGPGQFAMKKIPVIGKVKTKRGNYLIRNLVFNLAIEG
ncbi:MAG: hypothetical protein ABJF11_05180 [Reichenbachiella sp.]|uniref:toxin-antitoxin system YwqK family antitoxin n=1 Tax=Reichenbachiella sp. TaxID=2184521 RepID=UPI0032644630